jgi:predicted RNase H-like HicB family nuclease
MYRVGFPGWKLAARWNVPLLIRLNVTRDGEAGVYIATSPDLRGLVVEAATLEELHRELNCCVDMLLKEILKEPPKKRPATAWPADFMPA